jgi:hypothetical protein
MLQQALQQNPNLAAQLTQRLQPGNAQASLLLSLPAKQHLALVCALDAIWTYKMAHCVSVA